MAVFKTLRAKSKTYAFKFAGNEKLKSPALVVFSRFPLPDENFIKAGDDTRYSDVDFNKVGKKDGAEVQKLFSAFINGYLADAVGGAANFSKVDVPAFLRECVDHFENLYTEDGKGKTRKIKTVDDFLTLPEAAAYEIAKDIYGYARGKEDFSMGE